MAHGCPCARARRVCLNVTKISVEIRRSDFVEKSLDDGLIGQVLEIRAEPRTVWNALNHENPDEFFYRIDPETGTCGSPPVVFTNRSELTNTTLIHGNGESEPESDPVSSEAHLDVAQMMLNGGELDGARILSPNQITRSCRLSIWLKA